MTLQPDQSKVLGDSNLPHTQDAASPLKAVKVKRKKRVSKKKSRKPKATQRTKKVSRHKRDPDDYYTETPFEVHCLMAKEGHNLLGKYVIDPCCGGGNIPITLRKYGVNAHGGDLHPRWEGALCVKDFRDTIKHWRPEIIVSNPPFSQWEEIVDAAWDVDTEIVYLLLPSRFLEGQNRLSWYLSAKKLARFWQFSKRVSLPPGKSDMKPTGGKIPYSWYVFERKHDQETWTGGWLPISPPIPESCKEQLVEEEAPSEAQIALDLSHPETR